MSGTVAPTFDFAVRNLAFNTTNEDATVAYIQALTGGAGSTTPPAGGTSGPPKVNQFATVIGTIAQAA